jgi:hypothetical protein
VQPYGRDLAPNGVGHHDHAAASNALNLAPPLPADRLATISVPIIALRGSQAAHWMSTGTWAVADAIPRARHVIVEGRDRGMLNRPDALRLALVDVLS